MMMVIANAGNLFDVYAMIPRISIRGPVKNPRFLLKLNLSIMMFFIYLGKVKVISEDS